MPWGGVKKSNIIKFQLQSQFQRILNQTLCVFSQIRRDLHPVTWIMPKGRDLKVHTGGQKCNFLKMVMCHTKLRGMTRRLGFTEQFYPRIKLVTMRWCQKVEYNIRFFLKLGDLQWGAIKCVLVNPLRPMEFYKLSYRAPDKRG